MNSQNINYQGQGSFKIFTPNKILEFRANSFATKEPTTLEWLKSLEKDSILIDVGANIGIYTIPSALFHVKKVIAVEPEIKNYNMLLDNLKLNDLNDDKVEALPIGISTNYQNQITKIYITSDVAGASCHQVGRNQNHLLEDTSKNERISKSIYCVSLSSIVKQITTYHDGPIHIKIDVDGIEEDVCQSLFDDKTISRIATLQIELNSSLKSHAELINRLSTVGFEYSKEQVNRSIRKSGGFKGFAEIVFRRRIPIAGMESIPKSYTRFLGSNYTPLNEPEATLPESDFINLSNSKLVQIKKSPSTFILKDSFNSKHCSSLFHKVAARVLSSDLQSINFKSKKSGTVEQNNRCIISNNIIEKLSPGYLSELFKQAQSKEFVSTVLLSYKLSLQNNFNSNYLETEFPRPGSTKGQQIVCRIRHFLDLYGYSLDKHNDSPDTLCAIIMPILPCSTTTCTIGSAFRDRKILEDPNNKSNLKESEFRDTHYNSNSDFKQLNHFKKSNNEFTYLESYKYEPITLEAGESIVIPNMMSSLTKGEDAAEHATSITNHLYQISGHGVLPFVSEAYRPVLLIDYLLIKEKYINNGSIKTTDSSTIIGIGPAEKYFQPKAYEKS